MAQARRRVTPNLAPRPGARLGLAVAGAALALQLGIVLLGWAAARLLTPGWRGAGLRLALPLGLALWPMPVFINTVANNDVLAEVGVGAALVAALAWLQAIGSPGEQRLSP